MAIIEVKNISKSFGDVHVLENVSFEVNKGETVAVIGPSGAGKSTMLRCLIDLEQADSGDIYIDGNALCKDGVYVSEKESRAICAQTGMVFQNFNLFPHMSVLKNLTSVATIVHKVSKEDAVAQARELLKKVGLSDKENAYPSELSGGQKQRVAIARALMENPNILFFDEPTSSLDPQLTAEVLHVMRELSREKMTMVVVTHEMGFAREAADKILFMADRSIVACGTKEDIFDNPEDDRIKNFIASIL